MSKKPSDKSGKGQSTLNISSSDPMHSALEMKDRNLVCGDTGVRLLHFYQRQFWECLPAGYYRSIDEIEVKNRIWVFLYNASNNNSMIAFKPDQGDVANVLSALKAVCEVSSHNELPMWLPGAPADVAKLRPKDFLVVANGLLHVPTDTLYPSTSASHALC